MMWWLTRLPVQTPHPRRAAGHRASLAVWPWSQARTNLASAGPASARHVPPPSLGNTDSTEFDNGSVPLRADPTARHSRGNQGRFTT